MVARPIGAFKTSSDYHYQTMRCNVDLLKIIQVGLTLADEQGNFPQEVSTWQFNFRFSARYVTFPRLSHLIRPIRLLPAVLMLGTAAYVILGSQRGYVCPGVY